MPSHRLAHITLTFATVTLLGCALGEMSDVRAMAASSFRCGRESIEVVKVSEPTPESALYEAQGCGQRRRYVCEGSNALTQGSGRTPGGVEPPKP